MDQNTKKQKVAEAVLDYITNGESLGIGSGTTVNILIENLSKVKNKIRNVVSSSVKSTELLKANGFEDKSFDYKFSGIEKALELDDVDIRLFGKPKAWNNRRLGVILSKNREIGKKAKSLIFINKKNNY